jgi:hypothetical protein
MFQDKHTLWIGRICRPSHVLMKFITYMPQSLLKKRINSNINTRERTQKGIVWKETHVVSCWGTLCIEEVKVLKSITSSSSLIIKSTTFSKFPRYNLNKLNYKNHIWILYKQLDKDKNQNTNNIRRNIALRNTKI